MGSLPPEEEVEKLFKSRFAKTLASKRINEEFEYWAKVFRILGPDGIKAPTAVKYALENATTRDEKSEPGQALLDEAKRRDELPEGSKVGIVGAGMAGLYIAMILDELKIPNLSYEILEGSNRVGGRVYTHYFSEKKHDYYDVGAMRFPQVPIMKKTFNLFEHLEIPLLDYYFTSPRGADKNQNEPTRYNDRTIKNGQKGEDNFQVSEEFGGRIAKEIAVDYERYITETFEPFKYRLRENWTKGYQALMKFDKYSVRGYMMTNGISPVDDYYSIQWLETLTDGSGLFDQAFSEAVIDSMDFDYESEYINPTKKVKWFCVDGGTQLLPIAMNKSLSKPLEEKDLGKKVNKIAFERRLGGESKIKVWVSGEKEEKTDKPKAREYMTVFATPTLACMQRIDLTGLDLLYEQKDAIRSLHYDTATKVGMKFKKNWWRDLGIFGGLGKSDMPLRTCVYPSYNLDDPEDDTAVLLCSYSWAQDAARIGSLIKREHKYDPQDSTAEKEQKWAQETELKDTMIHDLTYLHIEHYKEKYSIQSDEEAFEKLHAWISELYMEHHAFNWHDYEFTSGAYGKFGPGQFSGVYTALTNTTADSRFHFVGEGVSEHHGWIVGALDSAEQAVLNFLRRFHLDSYVQKLKDIKWLQPVSDGIDEETSVMKVVLGLLDADRRAIARAAIEKGKATGKETLNLEPLKGTATATK